LPVRGREVKPAFDSWRVQQLIRLITYSSRRRYADGRVIELKMEKSKSYLLEFLERIV